MGAVEVGDSGACDPLKDPTGQALDIEHVHILQPHEGPGRPLQVLKGWEVFLHLFKTILQGCKMQKTSMGHSGKTSTGHSMHTKPDHHEHFL